MMANDRESALTRWSRRKQAHDRASGVPKRAAVPAEPEAAEPVPESSEAPASGEAGGATQAEGLPDLASLTAESDFSVFLGGGVPDDVHRQAMRALWKSDPLLTVHDGLTDYNDNYQTGEHFTGIVRSAWRVGRGFLRDDAPVQAEREGRVADAPPEAIGAPSLASAGESQDRTEDQPEDERLQAPDQSKDFLQRNKDQL